MPSERVVALIPSERDVFLFSIARYRFKITLHIDASRELIDSNFLLRLAPTATLSATEAQIRSTQLLCLSLFLSIATDEDGSVHACTRLVRRS